MKQIYAVLVSVLRFSYESCLAFRVEFVKYLMGDQPLAECWAAFLCRVSDAKDPHPQDGSILESMIDLCPKILERLTSSIPSAPVFKEDYFVEFNHKDVKLTPEDLRNNPKGFDLHYKPKDFLRHDSKVRELVRAYLEEISPSGDSEDFIKDLQTAMEQGEFTNDDSSFKETALSGRLVRIEDLSLETILGIGGFGFVAKARCDKFTPSNVAVKFEVFDKKDLVEYFCRSLFATGQVHASEFIVEILNYFSFHISEDKIAMCMVMPLCSGTLEELVKSLNKAYTLKHGAPKGRVLPGKEADQRRFVLTVVRDIALPIAKGLLAMHEEKPKPVAHRDMKPQNILIGPEVEDDEAALGQMVRTTDLGLARTVTENGTLMTNKAGTFR